MSEDEKNNINPIEPELDPDFVNSELYPYFGVVNIQENKYLCNVTFVISASDDIDIPKVIDFLKDFIPSQIEENQNSAYLEIFKLVNLKINEILVETLEEDSFINVELAYVLIEGYYMYVSLDDSYEVVVSRTNAENKIRKNRTGAIDGSGILKEGDIIELLFNNMRVLVWHSQLEESPVADYLATEYETPFTEIEPAVLTSEVVQEIDVENKEEAHHMDMDHREIDEQDQEVLASQQVDLVDASMDETEDELPLDEEEPLSFEKEHQKRSVGAGFSVAAVMDKIKPMAASAIAKSKDFSHHAAPIIMSSFKKLAQYLGDAFSYLISFVLRGKKRSMGRAFPNKTKGFLVISAFIFLIVLLAFFIKNTNEDNARKQSEQDYRNQVAVVSTKVQLLKDQIVSIKLDDVTTQSSIANLTSSLKNLEKNPLKSKLSLDSTFSTDYGVLNDVQDKVDGVIARIDEASVVLKFGGLAPNTIPSAMDVKDGKLYYNDSGNNKVYIVDPLAKTREELIGADAGLVKPVSVKIGKNGLFVLDQTKGMFLFDLTAKKIKPLGYEATSADATALATYYDKDVDNFYLLRPAKMDVQRIASASGGYAVASRYNPNDLEAGLEDFTIIGGQIFTVDSAGVINRYNRVSSTRCQACHRDRLDRDPRPVIHDLRSERRRHHRALLGRSNVVHKR